MTLNEYSDIKNSLDLNLEIDNNLRRIAEKIKIISSFRKSNLLTEVIHILTNTNIDLDLSIGTQCDDYDFKKD